MFLLLELMPFSDAAVQVHFGKGIGREFIAFHFDAQNSLLRMNTLFFLLTKSFNFEKLQDMALSLNGNRSLHIKDPTFFTNYAKQSPDQDCSYPQVKIIIIILF